jgi:hypothetical protein
MLARLVSSAVSMAVLDLALTACGGSTATTCQTGPGILPRSAPVLVYPAPGSRGVSTTVASIVIASDNGNAANVQPLYLQVNGQRQRLPTPGAAPVPLPSPLGTYPAGETLFGVIAPTLAAGTTYTVTYARQSIVNCMHAPTQYDSIGTFSTIGSQN